MQALIGYPANSSVRDPANGPGALVFKFRQGGAHLLLCNGFDASDPAEPRRQAAPDAQRHASAGVALQRLITSDSWLLAYARQRLTVLCRGALLVLPEFQLVLLRGQEINCGSFQDFHGTLLLMHDTAMSPQDRKLLAQRPADVRFDSAWARLLMAYLGALDAATLAFIGREESGGALIEQQIMSLLRRALRERAGGARPWLQRSACADRAQSRGELLYRNICAWVEDNFAMAEISSELAADHFQVSPRYVQNLFSRYGDGVTFVALVRNKRLCRAMEMLADPRYAHQNISEICWSCGFTDPVYFGKIFREKFGMTPGQARRHSFNSAS